MAPEKLFPLAAWRCDFWGRYGKVNMSDNQFDPLAAKEFCRLYSGLLSSYEAICRRKYWRDAKANGIEYRWPENRLFYPKCGLTDQIEKLHEIQLRIATLDVRTPGSQRYIDTGFEERTIVHESESELERLKIVEDLLRQRASMIHSCREGFRGKFSILGICSSTSGMDRNRALGALYSPYFPEGDIKIAYQVIGRIAPRLRRKTVFQRWLCSENVYDQLIARLNRKPMVALPYDSYHREVLVSLGADLTEWTFQYLLCRALIAYHCYKSFPDRLRSIYPSLVKREGEYSDKARRLSAKLAKVLRVDLGDCESRIANQLEAIANGKLAPRYRKTVVLDASITRRQSLFIRELGILGQKYLINKRSDQHRFPADIVVQCCELIDHSLANERSINQQLQRLETQEFHQPITTRSGFTGKIVY